MRDFFECVIVIVSSGWMKEKKVNKICHVLEDKFTSFIGAVLIAYQRHMDREHVAISVVELEVEIMISNQPFNLGCGYGATHVDSETSPHETSQAAHSWITGCPSNGGPGGILPPTVHGNLGSSTSVTSSFEPGGTNMQCGSSCTIQ